MGLIKPMYPTEELFNIDYDYQNPIVRLLTPLDIFALLMASIGHDVGHPGVNNNFMASTLLFKHHSYSSLSLGYYIYSFGYHL